MIWPPCLKRRKQNAVKIALVPAWMCTTCPHHATARFKLEANIDRMVTAKKICQECRSDIAPTVCLIVSIDHSWSR